MAETVAPAKAFNKGIGNEDRMAKARRTREINAQKMQKLSSEEKHCLKLVRSARQTLELIEQLVIDGKPIPVEVIQACGTLQSASAVAMY